MNAWYPVQVKQKDKVGRPDIDAFEAMMPRAERTKGFFVSFAYGQEHSLRLSGFLDRPARSFIPFTVNEILNAQIAKS